LSSASGKKEFLNLLGLGTMLAKKILSPKFNSMGNLSK
jgi:hypothetical protein